MGALIAGAMFKGEFEDRLKNVIKEIVESDGQFVLFIDEIHTLVGAGGGGEGAMDAANILKPALARGELRAIGATTLKEYQRFFEKDRALERRFQVVMVDQPGIEESISILRGLKEKYEVHHHVRIKDDAIIAAVELSSRYITDRFLPDKAIDLIDEAAAKLRMEMNSLPEELDEIERKIRQLEIEREAIKREKDKDKLNKLSVDIDLLSVQRNDMKEKWLSEKKIIDKIQQNVKNIEDFKFQAQQAELSGDYGKVAELRYGKIKDAEIELDSLKKQLSLLDSPLIKEEVGIEEIAEVVAKWTGIPVTKMMQSEIDKLLYLEEYLHKRVAGQDEAITAVSDAIRRSRAGFSDDKKPIASFIFTGTTGVGKTELAKAVAEYLFDNENAIVRVDMSEYQEQHTVSRLVGAPPGYVGYEEGGQLTEAVRRKPYSVVLLDEIEKAHPDVFNVLLQVLDDGRLTDNKGRIADFKNTIIIMTSNIGSQLIQERYENTKHEDAEQVYQQSKFDVMEMLKATVKPEFLNRVDEIIMFRPLSRKNIATIVNFQMTKVKEMLMKKNINLIPSKQALEYLAEEGYDPQYGARPLKRVIQSYVLNELSKELLAGKIKENSTINMEMFDGKIVFF
jgi:ATP-dependent Clp protease ATP-binding subunit ClpB